MSQQPGTCPRTTYELGLTWLAGGGPRPPRRPRRAYQRYFIHGGGGSTRPTRHGISSSTKGTTTQGARCDEPTKGTNHRAAGRHCLQWPPARALAAAIGHYSLALLRA